MAKRSYRKKSSRGKGSRKGSRRTYRKKGSRKGSRRTYRKKGSRKGSKKTSKRGSKKSKRCPKGEVRTMRKLANGKLGVGKCMPKPFGAKKVETEKKELDKAEVVLDKKEEKLEAAIIGGAPAPVIAELKEEVKEAKVSVEEKLKNLEEVAKEMADTFDYGEGDFNLLALGYRIRKRIKGSKRHSKRKSHGRKGSKKRHSKRKGSKKSKRKSSKRYSKRR